MESSEPWHTVHGEIGVPQTDDVKGVSKVVCDSCCMGTIKVAHCCNFASLKSLKIGVMFVSDCKQYFYSDTG